MGLPAHGDLPRETITLPDSQTLELRGLSRGEVMRSGTLDDLAEREIMAIAWATDTPLDETRAWYEKAPFAMVQAIVDALMRLSGTEADSGKGPSAG